VHPSCWQLALCLALALPAQAVPPDPNHTVISVLGRKTSTYTHYGDPARGEAFCSAQGETVDTNGNGLADALRGRSACREVRLVTRFVIYSSQLQMLTPAGWQLIAIESNDAFSSGDPAYVVDYTPTVGFCPAVHQLQTYRIVHSDGIRWADGVLGTRTTVSNNFQARMLNGDPRC
jgi:hypothetical protein